MTPFQDGMTKGRLWAKEKATRQQLQALQRAHANLLGGTYREGEGNGDGLAWLLYSCLHEMDPDWTDVDTESVERFWRSILGDGGDIAIQDPNLARGFCDGALCCA
jgi:hypothetical protein